MFHMSMKGVVVLSFLGVRITSIGSIVNINKEIQRRSCLTSSSNSRSE